MFIVSTRSLVATLAIANLFNLIPVHCKQYRCSLAKVFYYQFKVSKSLIPSMLCYIEHSSEYDKSKVTEHGDVRRYGLFQFKGGIDCAEKESQLDNTICPVPCSKMTDDQLSDDVRCWRKIYSKHGFAYWPEWSENCKGKFLMAYLQGCFLD